MASRIELHNELVSLFGSNHVYYNPPESLKMTYPAIRYVKEYVYNPKADNIGYYTRKRYQITVIDKSPDNPVIDKLLGLPMSTFERHYISDNLNHDVINLYY